MIRFSAIVSLVILGIAVCGISSPARGSNEPSGAATARPQPDFRKRLEGTWIQLRREVKGQQRNGADGITLVVAPDGMMKTYTPVQSSERPGPTLARNVYFRIDETHDPVVIDETGREDWSLITEGLGICRLENDEFTVCFAAKNQPRPTVFSTDSQQGGGDILIVYRKAAPDRK